MEKPPFSPRHVTLRNDKAFADEFKVIDFLGRFVFRFNIESSYKS